MDQFNLCRNFNLCSYIEPHCDMPWGIYLDWLQDQGVDDLAEIDVHSLSFSSDLSSYNYTYEELHSSGFGAGTQRDRGQDSEIIVYVDVDFIGLIGGDGSLYTRYVTGKFNFDFVYEGSPFTGQPTFRGDPYIGEQGYGDTEVFPFHD